jgi:hypothetical protein
VCGIDFAAGLRPLNDKDTDTEFIREEEYEVLKLV